MMLRLALTAAFAVVSCTCAVHGGSGSGHGPTSATAAVTPPPRDPGNLDYLLRLLGWTAKEARTPSNAIEVIAAGASKTGTKSLAVALKRLGFQPYDILAAAELDQVDLFHAATVASDGRPYKLLPESAGDVEREAALDALYSGMLSVGARATLDAPFTYLYEDLLARNPHAKVILTTRSSTESWSDALKVMGDAIAPLYGLPWTHLVDARLIAGAAATVPPQLPVNGLFWRPWWAPWINLCYGFDPPPPYTTEDVARLAYTQHNANVRARVPPGQLLEFNLTDGWAPLCAFLEVQDDACPLGQPFPHTNSRAEVVLAHYVLRVVAVGYPFILVLLLLLVYAALRCLCCCCSVGGGAGERKKKGTEKTKEKAKAD